MWYAQNTFGTGAGVYVSADTGKTWAIATTASVNNLTLDENGYLLGMLNSKNTVVRSLRIAATSVRDVAKAPAFVHSSTLQNRLSCEPNPASSFCTLRYRVHSGSATPSVVRIELFSLAGERISTLEHTERPTGEHSVMFRTEMLSQGVYICRIAVNGEQGMVQVRVLR